MSIANETQVDLPRGVRVQLGESIGEEDANYEFKLGLVLSDLPTSGIIQWAEHVAHFFCRNAKSDIRIGIMPLDSEIKGFVQDYKKPPNAPTTSPHADAIILTLEQWTQVFHHVMIYFEIEEMHRKRLREELNDMFNSKTKSFPLSLPMALYFNNWNNWHDLLVPDDSQPEPVLIYSKTQTCRLESISVDEADNGDYKCIQAMANFQFRDHPLRVQLAQKEERKDATTAAAAAAATLASLKEPAPPTEENNTTKHPMGISLEQIQLQVKQLNEEAAAAAFASAAAASANTKSVPCKSTKKERTGWLCCCNRPKKY